MYYEVEVYNADNMAWEFFAFCRTLAEVAVALFEARKSYEFVIYSEEEGEPPESF